LGSQGTLEVGAPANLVVFDPKAAADTSGTQSRSSNAPYSGLELRGAVVHTIYRGAFTVRNRAVTDLSGVAG